MIHDQISKLRQKGFDTSELDRVLERVERLNLGDPDALLVIPFNIIPFEKQLEAVDLGSSKKAYTFLDPKLLIDLQQKMKLPQVPYLLMGIEDGTAMLGKSPEEASKLLFEQRRRPMTVNQGLSLVLHRPEILSHHNIHLSGSGIRDAETREVFAPDFYVYAGRLKMKRDAADDADPRWGTPSYRDIIPL